MKQLIGFIILCAVLFGCQKPKPPRVIIKTVTIYRDTCNSEVKPKTFDDKIKHYAKIAKEFYCRFGVPVSIQLAQAIYESGLGSSNIALCSNNAFGIKAYSNWKGKVFKTESGTLYRAYESEFESWEDHAKFMHNNYIHAVGKDWKHWVKYCKGYGGENYWYLIGELIEQKKLYKFD